MWRKKGQNIVEYAVILSTIVVIFVMMQHYVSRGMQGRMVQIADSVGPQFDPRGYFMYVYRDSSNMDSSVSETRLTTTLYTVDNVTSIAIFPVNFPELKTGYNVTNESATNYKEESVIESSIEKVLPWE